MPCLLSRLLAATSLRSCARLRLRGFPPKASLYYGAFGVPCNTTATHPAAPLGSRRRSAPPLSFATRNLQKWQEVNEDELCDEIFTSNFQSPFRRGALKVAFKQKLVPRITRPTLGQNSSARPTQSPPGGAASPLPDSPPYGQRGRCPSRGAKSCAKHSK